LNSFQASRDEKNRLVCLISVPGYPSGQRGVTVNHLAYAFGSSNLSPGTITTNSMKYIKRFKVPIIFFALSLACFFIYPATLPASECSNGVVTYSGQGYSCNEYHFIWTAIIIGLLGVVSFIVGLITFIVKIVTRPGK
jgi:hypothetical protein